MTVVPRKKRQPLHQQAADREIEQVLAPFEAKDRLLAPTQQAFDWDEDNAREDKAEQEPIEAEVDVAFDVEPSLRARAAERGRQENQGQGHR
jgi:hypothetical protein